MTRPRLRQTTTQVSLYLDATEAPALLPEGPSKSGAVVDALRKYAQLRALASQGVKAAIAALALLGSLESAPQEMPHENPQETTLADVVSCRTATSDAGREAPELHAGALRSAMVGVGISVPAASDPEDGPGADSICPIEPVVVMEEVTASASKQHNAGLAATGESELACPASDRRGGPILSRPIPPKPRFPAQAYLDDRGPLLSAARKALFEEYPDELPKIDKHALGLSPHADGECWLEVYQSALTRLRAASSALSVDEDAPTPTLAPAPPPSKAALWHQCADPLLRERLSVEDLTAIWNSLPNPPRTLTELAAIEDGLIPQVELEERLQARIEGGRCWSHGTGGVLRQVAGFNQAGAATEQKAVDAKHAKLRAEREAFRAERKAAFRAWSTPRTLEEVVGGVVIDMGGSTRRLP